jgi:hypothetical protein
MLAAVPLVACAPATPTATPSPISAPTATGTPIPTDTPVPPSTVTKNPEPTATAVPSATATRVATAVPTLNPERRVIANTVGYVSFNAGTLSIDSSPLAAGTNVKPTISKDGKYTVYEGLVQVAWTNENNEKVTGFVDAKTIGITEGELKNAKTLTHADNPLGFPPVPPGGSTKEEMDKLLSNPKAFGFSTNEYWLVNAMGRYVDSVVGQDGLLKVKVNVAMDPSKKDYQEVTMPINAHEPLIILVRRNNRVRPMIVTRDSMTANLAIRHYFGNTDYNGYIRATIYAETVRETLTNNGILYVYFED